ncbi:MAG: ABC transporter permease [Chloroflexota bacterium]
MNYITDTWYLTGRHVRYHLRMPVHVGMSLIQPLIWLLLFTQVFRRLSDMPGFPTQSYLQFFAPGVVVMTVLFGSAWSGMGMLRDIDLGMLTKMLVTPVTRLSIVASRMLATTLTVIAQSLIILIIAYVMGVSFATGAPGLLLTILTVALLGLGFAGLSNALALLYRKPEPLMATIGFLTLPLTFVSSAMMPASMLPGWMNTLRTFNPVDHAVQSVRTLAIIGYEWEVLVPSLAFLLSFAAIMTIVATIMFRTIEE